MRLGRGIKELIFVIALISIGLIVKLYFNNQIRYRGAISNAYISKIWVTKKPVFTRLEYSYVVKGDSFFTYYDVDNGIDFQKLKLLQDRTVLFIYDSTNVKANRLLLIGSDFERYNVPYPDSMVWLKNLLEK